MMFSKITKFLLPALMVGILSSCISDGDESIVLTPQPEPPAGVVTNLISTSTGGNVA